MCDTDDTTTRINPDTNEDKILFLSGPERKKYFTDEFPAVSKPLDRKRGVLIKYISKLLR